VDQIGPAESHRSRDRTPNPVGLPSDQRFDPWRQLGEADGSNGGNELSIDHLAHGLQELADIGADSTAPGVERKRVVDNARTALVHGTFSAQD
jgi:hypothetical protein